MLNILIAENVPSLNKGEMTILEGMLEIFDSFGQVKVTMLSALPEVDEARYFNKVNVLDLNKAWSLYNRFHKSAIGKIVASIIIMAQHLLFMVLYKTINRFAFRIFKSEIWKVYIETDIVVIGHNGTFGLGGNSAIPLFYHIYTPPFFKCLNKPRILLGGSINIVKRYRRLSNILFKLSLACMDLITLRETESLSNLRALGLPQTKIHVTGDPAFLMQPASPIRIKEIIEREKINKLARPIIGITVTREMACTAFSNLGAASSYERHNKIISEVIEGLIANLQATIMFIPHCIGFGDALDDRIVAGDILQKCSNCRSASMISNEYSASELKGLIGEFDLFIGERLHSVINAMAMAIPSIAICKASDQRLDIIRMFGQSDSLFIAEELASDYLLSKIKTHWVDRVRIKEELVTKNTIMQQKAMLNRQFLKELLVSRGFNL